jgi:hypothetical protein
MTRKVKLIGGTNDGRTITVLHGAAVSVKKVAPGIGREMYKAAKPPVMDGGVELWHLLNVPVTRT